MHLIGQGCTEKYYMGDIILYNPDQSSLENNTGSINNEI